MCVLNSFLKESFCFRPLIRNIKTLSTQPAGLKRHICWIWCGFQQRTCICTDEARAAELPCPRLRRRDHPVITPLELLSGCTGRLETSAERGAELGRGLMLTTHPQPPAGFGTQSAPHFSLSPLPARGPAATVQIQRLLQLSSGTWEEDKALWRELTRPTCLGTQDLNLHAAILGPTTPFLS